MIKRGKRKKLLARVNTMLLFFHNSLYFHSVFFSFFFAWFMLIGLAQLTHSHTVQIDFQIDQRKWWILISELLMKNQKLSLTKKKKIACFLFFWSIFLITWNTLTIFSFFRSHNKQEHFHLNAHTFFFSLTHFPVRFNFMLRLALILLMFITQTYECALIHVT